MVIYPEILYLEDAFIYIASSFKKQFTWSEITLIIAYKVDLIAVDNVRLDIFDDVSGVTISEEEYFWNDLTKLMLKKLPEIDSKWFPKVAHPPFAQNKTVLYKKELH